MPNKYYQLREEDMMKACTSMGTDGSICLYFVSRHLAEKHSNRTERWCDDDKTNGKQERAMCLHAGFELGFPRGLYQQALCVMSFY